MVRMDKREFCREYSSLFQCSFCKRYFCNKHLLPENHLCTHLTKEEIISEVVKRKTAFNLFAVARFISYIIIILGFVLTVDAMALWLLNLLMNKNMWLTLLFWEALLLMLFGLGDYAFGSRFSFSIGWKRPRIITILLRPPSAFLFAIAFAGVALIILSACVVWWFYWSLCIEKHIVWVWSSLARPRNFKFKRILQTSPEVLH